jgi:hypothetical protein
MSIIINIYICNKKQLSQCIVIVTVQFTILIWAQRTLTAKNAHASYTFNSQLNVRGRHEIFPGRPSHLGRGYRLRTSAMHALRNEGWVETRETHENPFRSTQENLPFFYSKASMTWLWLHIVAWSFIYIFSCKESLLILHIRQFQPHSFCRS